MTAHFHGPGNAEFEIRKAYNVTIESGVTYAGRRTPIAGVNPDEVPLLYRRAYQFLRDGNRLAAERWARTTKHLARAFWHEAKIAYLEARLTELPFIRGATGEEYNLHEESDTTEDLLNSLADHAPPGMLTLPEPMKLYLARARKHLEVRCEPLYTHELLCAERLKAAHEYGRVLECMALAFEAQSQKGQAA